MRFQRGLSNQAKKSKLPFMIKNMITCIRKKKSVFSNY